MKTSINGVILAGGLSSRFSCKDKAHLKIREKKILDYIYDVFKDLFNQITIVTSNPLHCIEWNCNIAADIFPVKSSLTGIHTGLFFSSTSHTFFSACDLPFLKKEVVETIIERVNPSDDVIIPETSTGIEPLCAVYSSRCLKPVADNIVRRKFKIQSFFKQVRVKRINEEVLRKKDSELLSFFNINTPEDLVRAEEILAGIN